MSKNQQIEIRKSTLADLTDIASCHTLCFPSSFAVKLGKKSISKSFTWFMKDEYRYMFHLKYGDEIIGYYGGFFPKFIGDGSKSGMLNEAFTTALTALLCNPKLILKKELYIFSLIFLKNKLARFFFKKAKSPNQRDDASIDDYLNSFALSVIGIHPKYRGRKLGSLLLQHMENLAIEHSKKYMTLSLKKGNTNALQAYIRNGWLIVTETDSFILMKKKLPSLNLNNNANL